MAARYLLCPGWVTSRTDGDRHYVGASQLAMLYGVSMAECMVLPDPSSFENAMRRSLLLDRMVHGELIPLSPRKDGDYKLPKSTQEEA